MFLTKNYLKVIGENTIKEDCKLNHEILPIDSEEKFKETDFQAKYDAVNNYLNGRVIQILSLESSEFNYEYFHDLQKTEKVIYVLKTFLGIRVDNIIEINRLWAKPWARVISNCLNPQIIGVVQYLNTWFKINPKDIQDILNRNKN